MEQYIGKLLDNRYEILERIGSGGMAVVYKARCHRLNRLVAIKILKEDLAQDADFRRRFHDESQAVAMLSHPNIMAVYDVSKSDHIDYIVMELIDGITLKQYMQKKGDKLSWREALHFITQIMKALSHAHSRGIIHRDIKPHNIMVLRDGSVKVTDFGIARLTTAAQNTLTQEALGSVHYISPEQARGSHIDARSDIYSAGVVLYEIVTGRLPYEGESPVSVAIQHINSIPLSPRELEADIPEALEAIIMKAMASHVDQRYISADAMLSDLEEFRKNPSINFDFSLADLLPGDCDEPTQVLGANTPSGVHGQRAHAPRSDREDTAARRRRNTGRLSDGLEDDGYDPPRRRGDRGGLLPIIAAVAVILVFVLAIGYFIWTAFLGALVNPPQALAAPTLTSGITVEEARALPEIKNNGFEILEGTAVVSETIPKGQIVSQDPQAGAVIPTGDSRSITVSVSLGKAELLMPDFYNTDERTATLKLTGMNLNVVIEKANSDDILQGNVVTQNPAADSALRVGQTVTLTVSQGPKVVPVLVISFLGLTYDDAKQKATKELHLVVKQERAFDATVSEGYIISQSIPPYTEVSPGSIIIFRVSKGPEVMPTPSPSPDVSVPPALPTPTLPASPAVETNRQIKVELPQDGRTNVRVRIQVGSNANAYDQWIETQIGVVFPNVRGSGPQEVITYIDEVAVKTETVAF